MTNREIGEQIGCTHSAVSRIRRGVRLPSFALARRIGEVYDIPLDDLVNAFEMGPARFGELFRHYIDRHAPVAA